MTPTTPQTPKRPDSASPFAAIPRYDHLWLALPLVIVAYLWALELPMRSASAVILDYSLIATLVLGFALILGAYAWIVSQRLVPRTPLLVVGVPGFTGGLAFLMPAAARGSWVDLGAWIFVLSSVVLMAILAARALLELRRARHPIFRTAHDSPRQLWRDFNQLTKLGLNSMVLVTTFAGYYMAAQGPIRWPHCVLAIAATGLVAMGASVLNQWMEMSSDLVMDRTRRRPLPEGRIHPMQAILLGAALNVAGLLLLAYGVGMLAAFLAALSMIVYVFLYTPLKRINNLSTLAGAISGALPPVIGWTAAGGGIGPTAVALFFILFLWQIPHFLAIAWKYREQYADAGLVMLSVQDPDGRATSRMSLLYAVALLVVSLMPFFQGAAGWVYLVGAAIAGLFFAARGLRFVRTPDLAHARALFLGSLLYLPLTLTLLLLDKIA